jgi:GNAT superfamily N-acetyltransferase
MLTPVRVSVTTWSLEMTDPAELRAAPPPPPDVELRQAAIPSPELSRFLYSAVGGNWYWTDRLGWTLADWRARLGREDVGTWVLYRRGTPAGYFELDGGAGRDVEIAYFGLLPAFVGQGLGGWLLSEAIRTAWGLGATRVWVHTCTLDAPGALANYQARGMRVFREESAEQELAEVPPGPWPGAGLEGPRTELARV